MTQTAGLAVIDPVENRRVSLLTDTPVSPTDLDADRLAYPIDSACRITTDRLHIPYPVAVHIRSANGGHVATVNTDIARQFPHDEYVLDLQAPVKLYLRVTAAFEITQKTDSGLDIQFDDAIQVTVGARSYHSQPAATITVPDDPSAVMETVSHLSSGLKTTSPERSWPTLRGHPPRIELGSELDIPDAINRPDTDVELAIPAEYPYIFAAAPLAYYLAADLQPTDDCPTLSVGETVLMRFGTGVDTFADEVAELLQRILTLDCVVRTEGDYPFKLYERTVVKEATDLNLKTLYDADRADRLETYLAVPDRMVEQIRPTWHRVTHARPDADMVELLPYVVNDLSLVKIADRGGEWTPSAIEKSGMEALDAFARSPDMEASAGPNDFTRSKNLTRSGDELLSTEGVPGRDGYVPLPDGETVERAWVGERTRSAERNCSRRRSKLRMPPPPTAW
ncbi:hypothetical protein [Halorussus sp. MSC15.2]|uniref:hypothetical protein n=1 Tax=Halorussus sp. MSC15.2 TaxID=2283638 RepID=UPI0013D3E3D6|nr:hypothetical protein [Halorussus sp. MSC15.2]NEU59142.1 hypothetical protein [Halorussus sp. MSC15.2]